MEYITKEKFMVVLEPGTEWVLPLPTGAEYPYVEILFDEDGKKSDWSYTSRFEGDNLIISFELETHVGAVLYKWQVMSNVITDDEDNVVNITVNQNGSPEETEHQVINITNTKVIEVENKSMHSRQLKVYQFLEEVDGVKLYQDYTESVDLLFTERVSDGKKFIRIESNMPLTGFIELF